MSSGRCSRAHSGRNVATNPTPPTGMVTAQTLKLAPLVVVQPVQVPKEKPELGVAVSATEAPTGTTAMHVTDGQLIPYDKLVTVPPRVGVTCTLSVASVLPPGQVATVGLSTVRSEERRVGKEGRSRWAAYT